MTPQEEALFRNARRSVPTGTTLKRVIGDDERSATLTQFCEQLKKLIPQLAIVAEDGDGQAPPHLLLPDGIRYQGIPQGNEVPPFVEALAGILPPPADSLRERLRPLTRPARLELYVTPHCTFCPAAVRRLIPLASGNRLIQLIIIDGSMYPELVSRDGIQSVPTLVLDGQYRWTGSIKMEEIADLIATRDSLALTPIALEMMLKQGAAKQLAKMMSERNVFFPGLIELLCREEWPVRLGAMVAVEELNALRPDLAQQLIDPIWQRMDALPGAVQGDLFYVLGEIGGPAVIPRLTVFLQGDVSAEVRDAVREALGKLIQKKPRP